MHEVKQSPLPALPAHRFILSALVPVHGRNYTPPTLTMHPRTLLGQICGLSGRVQLHSQPLGLAQLFVPVPKLPLLR